MPNNDNYEYMRFLDLTGVQQIWDTAKQTFVRTVNGVGIDANGNVNVSNGLTEEQTDFIISEYNKSLNLFNKENISVGAVKTSDGSITSDSAVSHSDYIEIEPSTAYSNNMVMNWSSGYGLAFYDSNKSFISGIASNNSNYNHFTTPSNAKYVIISWYNASSDLTFYTDVNTLMLHKGSTLLPYQAYNGEIIHKKDIEPVLLWQNPNPSASGMQATHITLNDSVANYKYVVIGFKDYSGFATVRYQTFKAQANWNLCLNSFVQGALRIVSRKIVWESNTQYLVDTGEVITNGTYDTDSTFAIPLFIYGTNDLGYIGGSVTEEVSYITTAPTADNTSGNLKFVVLNSEPSNYYNGYIYYITEE